MKTQLKRLSKSTLAVVLSVCLLVSCMTVGIIATDAAKTAEDRVGAVDNSEAVGDTTYYYRGENVAGSSWDPGVAFSAVSGSDKYVYVTKSNNSEFQITNYQSGWNDSGRYNQNVDNDYGIGNLTNGSSAKSNMGDSNTGTHYIIFDTTSGNHKTFALAAAPVIDTIYIRDDANWGRSNIKLYTFSNQNSGTNSPANGQTLGKWAGRTNMAHLSVTDLDDDGTTIYKVTGFLHTAGLILTNSDDNTKTGDMTLTSGHLYSTGTGAGHDEGAYTEKTVLTTPTFTVDKNAVNGGDSATFTVTNYSTSGVTPDSNHELRLYKGDTDLGTFSAATKTITVTGTDTTIKETQTYTVKNVPTVAGSAAYNKSKNNNTANIDVYYPVYSIIGNVDKTYLASVNGGAPYNGTYSNGGWDIGYDSTYAVNTATSTPGVYTITLNTLTASQLSANSHSNNIDIALYKKDDKKYSFYLQSTNTYYNAMEADYPIPNSGVTAAMGLYVQTRDSSNGGGSIVMSPNRSYTITIDERQAHPLDSTNNPNGRLEISSSTLASSSNYSLTGNIDTTYLAEINGVTNTISRGDETDAVWWAKYQTNAAISTVESGTDVYSITVKTVDYATLKANGHDDIDIGLSMKGNIQKGFSYGGTDYNVAGRDYKVTSAGMTNASIISATGGSFQLQPGRTYKITVDEANSKLSVACIDDPADKYFLAGQYTGGVAQFFGSTWNTSNNELTYNSTSGCYEKTFTTNIPAGTINFKVVKNGDSDGWDGGSWPAENQSYVIRENATSVKFTFDPSTHTTTVTQTNSGGGGSSGSWVPGDKYTSSGTINSNRKVDDTPNIGTTNEYSFIWNGSDTGLGNNSQSVATVRNSNYGYWADLTEAIGSNENFFFALSDSGNQGGIRGNNNEKINNATASDGNDIVVYTSSGDVAFRIQRKQNGSVSSNARYVMVRDVHWDKVSNIACIAYWNDHGSNGLVDYQFYFKEKGATPVVGTKVVDICAKDGTLRDDTFNRFARLATTTIDSTYFDYTDDDGNHYTSITAYNNAKDPDIVITRESYGGTDAGYTKMTNVPVGAKVKIKTTLSDNDSATGSFNNTAFKNTHYVKGYSFNGMTYQVNEWESDGVYEEIWTVRAVNTTYKDSNGVERNATTDGKTVEVTPIYYMKNNTNCKTFLIDGYDGEVQNAWGNMLAVYPYYEGKNNKDNAFGGYPGQPMLLWGGKYQMEIPLTVDGTASGASVKGLTLHNAYWDLLHRSIDIRCNARNHAQTYDYDDFYKLYKEKNPDTIIFDFKYKTANDNFGDGYNYFNYEFAGTSGSEPTKDAAHYAASGKNGVEIVTDYFGRQVDVFGNLLTDAQKSDYDASHPQDKELLIVSTGYKDTYVGEYATLWAVYAPQSSIPSGSNDTAGKFIGYISSSMLYLNNWDRRLQYTGGDSTADGRMSWSQFQTTYDHLKTYYRGVPALISYEKEIWNDSKDKANRSDGKWYYSNKSDKIEASIKIQYGSYTLLDAPDHSVSSDAWRDDPFDQSQTGIGGEKNIGNTTRCSAYFTNTTPNLLGKVASGEQFADSTKKFTFEAVPSSAYMFAGWVRYSNGKYYEITESEIGESPMSANDVYIARFVDAQIGSLTVQHVVEQTDTYTGTGTPEVTVTVKDGSGSTVETFTNSTVGEKLDISKYIDSHFATHKIEISLATTPTNESYMKEIVSSSGNFAASPSSWGDDTHTTRTTATVAQFTVQDVLDSGVTSLRYVSHLQKPTYTYQYQITYYYNSRFWGVQSYTQTGTCEDGDFTGSKTTAKLNTDFIINKTPYEKNFREKIQWNYTDSAVTIDGKTANAMQNNSATLVSGTTYKMTAKVYSANEIDDMVRAEIILPYTWDFSQESGYTNKGTDMYDSSGNKLSDTECVYDASVEGPTLETMLYKLFTYNEKNSASDYKTGSDNLEPHKLKLIEAAPYVVKDGATAATKIQYHKTQETKYRYFTSTKVINGVTYKYFTVNDVNYYYGAVPDTDATGVLVTDTAQFTVTYHGVEHHYAVLDSVKDELYTFDDATAAEKGQYRWFYRGDTIDGVVQNTGVKKYFTRWDIYNSKGEFVASSYNRYFNYSGYDNYVVKAIYESDTEVPVEYDSVKPISTAITYLDDSRNQWNNDSGESGSGNYASVTHQADLEDADKLFTDFAISYSYYGKNINTISNRTTDPTNGANIKVGMIIERLGVLDTSGGKYITSASHYADKYKGDTGWQNLEGRLDGSTSGTLTSAVTNSHKCYNSKIGANYSVDGYTPFGTAAPGANPSQTSVIDNFNRLQWFYTINNFGTASDMKKYAYRAVSYIVVEDSTGTHAYLCDAPTYFTIYDTATRVGY